MLRSRPHISHLVIFLWCPSVSLCGCHVNGLSLFSNARGGRGAGHALISRLYAASAPQVSCFPPTPCISHTLCCWGFCFVFRVLNVCLPCFLPFNAYLKPCTARDFCGFQNYSAEVFLSACFDFPLRTTIPCNVFLVFDFVSSFAVNVACSIL